VVNIDDSQMAAFMAKEAKDYEAAAREVGLLK
jgi:hypothetical protein